MCATINAPNSELAKIIDIDSLQVNYYVKGIVEKLQSISEYRGWFEVSIMRQALSF